MTAMHLPSCNMHPVNVLPPPHLLAQLSCCGLPSGGLPPPPLRRAAGRPTAIALLPPCSLGRPQLGLALLAPKLLPRLMKSPPALSDALSPPLLMRKLLTVSGMQPKDLPLTGPLAPPAPLIKSRTAQLPCGVVAEPAPNAWLAGSRPPQS